ncbi:MAG: CSLREA domain-containing protein [Planctomycetota bacterium JB042]
MIRPPRLLPLSVLLLVAAPGVAHAGKFAVNTLDDTVDANPGDGVGADADGKCSLRAAIMEANASPGGDKIVLPSGYTFLLTLTGASEDGGATGDLDVDSKIKILGNGCALVAAPGDRVLDVSESGDLRLDDVTIRDGQAPDGENGGNVRNRGTLRLTRSTVEGGEALGVAGSGGNLFNSGDLEIVDCTLAGGRAFRAGGAVEADGGETILVRTSVVQNSAGPTPGNGGGLHITGDGDAVISKCEVVSNTAAREGGGAWNSIGTMKVVGSTFANNVANGDAADDGGGGLFNDGGVLNVKNSDLLWNLAPGTSGSGGGLFSIGGTVTVTKGEITRNEAARAGGGIEVVDGTLEIEKTTIHENTASANPGNGGGLHVTGTSTQVSLSGATVSGNVAALEGGGLWNQSGSTMDVVKTDVVGNTASGDAADDGGGGIFNNGGTLNVTNSSILGNLADGTSGSGGGILSLSGAATVTKSTISGNRASRAGGGVEVVDDSLSITKSDFDDNVTGANPGNGGAIHVTGTSTNVSVVKSSFRGNVAAEEGGAVWNQTGSIMTIFKSVFEQNEARGDGADQGGGALFNNGGTLDVTSSTIRSNTATGAAGSGGGILNDQGTLTVTDAVLRDNTAIRAGGGIETNVGMATVTNSDLRNNETGASPGNGGGLHITGAGVVDVTNGKVVSNAAANEGGGLWNSSTGTLTVTGTKLQNNSAPTGPDVFTQAGGSTTIE